MHACWPILLIVASDLLYHICSKSAPSAASPFASLTVTYLVGAAVSTAVFFLQNPGGSLLEQYRQLNWSCLVLGVVIVALEAGAVYLYKAGWALGTGQLICSSLLAVGLMAVGCLLYHEPVSPAKIAGMLVCLAGLYLISR